MGKSSNALVTFFKQICFGCGERGHYVNKCPQRCRRISQLIQILPLPKVSSTLRTSRPLSWEVRRCHKLLRIPHKPHRIGGTTIAEREVTISMGAPIHVYISLLLWSQIQLHPLVKRLPKFASIAARVVTLPSSVPIDPNDRHHRTRNAIIVKKMDTLLLHAAIHVHVLLFHRQQRQHLTTKEVLHQLKRPWHDSIMDRLIILPIDAPTSISYWPQPKATRMWYKL
jgi:hypothetical protein